MSMGRKRKPGPKRAPRKTGGIVKGTTHVMNHKREAIAQLRGLGHSGSKISSAVDVPKSTVNRMIREITDRGTVNRVKGSGRPRITTASEDERIVLSVKRDRGITSKEISAKLTPVVVSDKTVRRRIEELTDLKSTFKIRKPFIRPTNRRIRVRWCMDRLHYTIEQWSNFLWSDESPFVLRFCQKTRCWRLSSERNCTFAITGSVKHDEKIMVWGCFAAHGVGELVLIDGIMDQYQYIEILRTAVRRSADLLFQGRNWTFQQDNDPKHTAINTQRAIHEMQIPLEDWPSQSPDLNPIENLWSILDRSISDRRCNTKAELWECLQEAWYKLDSSILTKLVESMPRRLNAVIDNKGYPTKY